jgi:serine/threonine protein kinase
MLYPFAIGNFKSIQDSFLFRDIKPCNLLISQTPAGPLLTLIDFNVARRFKEPHSSNKLLMMTNTGTQCFAAPELHDH